MQNWENLVYLQYTKMTLLIKVEPNKTTLKLLKNRRVIDIETARYYYDLDRVLISALDKILKRTILDIKALKSYKILGKVDKNSTSYKIASVFVEGLKVKI